MTGKPKGRPPKQKLNRGRLTVRLPVDTIAGVKRAAKRQKISQADFIDQCVRPVLIADGIIKEPRHAKG
jgi:predicted HicB family RNase H-like nuclease